MKDGVDPDPGANDRELLDNCVLLPCGPPARLEGEG